MIRPFHAAIASLLLPLGSASLVGQDIENVAPPPVPQLVNEPASPGLVRPSPAELIGRAGAAADETVILDEVRGIVFLSSPDQVRVDGFAELRGFDVSRVPLLQREGFDIIPRSFLGQPASQPSLLRLSVSTRVWLGGRGYPYASVYLPEQDITEGVIQVVVEPSRMSGEVVVEGARWFKPETLAAAVRQSEGEPIDATQLKADIDWLNRNPFRQVNAVTAGGPERGTTVLKLNVVDTLPLRFNTGYQNTGSYVSDEDRLFAGFTWGNAFNRGDQFGYQFNTSPDLTTSTAHSFTYAADLPWRHVIHVNGMFSQLNGRVAPPLDLSGRAWQLGLRYRLPLAGRNDRFSQDLGFGMDFKASDNNLLFSFTPVTDNLTHIYQAVVSYDASLTDAHGITQWGGSLIYSPGGVSRHNDDTYFNVSRAGAKADYVYGNLRVSRQQRLPLGVVWAPRLQMQLANGNLLGSEQMAGGGAYSVRGYEEGEVYGDQGFLFSHEIIFPSLELLGRTDGSQLRDALQLFVFQDMARLANVDRLPGEPEHVDLHSVGVGFRYHLGPTITANVTQGWQLKDSGVSRGGENSRVHLYLRASF